MHSYCFYYTQNKIKLIPNELIKDIEILFKNIYNKNELDEIYKLNSKISSFDNIYTGLYIIRLNNKKIYIKLETGWFIIDINISGVMECYPDDSDYELIVNCLIILCIYYNVIENKWTTDGDINKNIMKNITKELSKLGFKQFNCKYNKEDDYYFINDMIKN